MQKLKNIIVMGLAMSMQTVMAAELLAPAACPCWTEDEVLHIFMSDPDRVCFKKNKRTGHQTLKAKGKTYSVTMSPPACSAPIDILPA